MIFSDVNDFEILQLKKVADWHERESIESINIEILNTIMLQHFENFKLWHLEDKARDIKATDEIISQVKRLIDKTNQNRNDFIEIIDELIIKIVEKSDVKLDSFAKMNSETPGSIIDRLSINALKIFHMKEESIRASSSEALRERACKKHGILEIQRKDLVASFYELLDDISSGKRYFRLYKQMKMYNDPTLNPVLYSNS